MKIKISIILFSLFSIFIMVAYQNCGGPQGSLWGEGSFGSSCSDNPFQSICSERQEGDEKLLSLTLDDSSQSMVVSKDESEYYFSGTCNDGSFIKNSIRWDLKIIKKNGVYLSQPITISSVGRPGVSCSGGNFRVTVENNSLLNANEGDAWVFNAEIIGIDRLGKPYFNNINGFVNTQVRVLKVITPPILNAANWTGSSSVKLLEGDNSIALNNLYGTCKKPSVGSSRVKLYIKEYLGQDSENPYSEKIELAKNQNIECLNNGQFSFNPITINYSGGIAWASGSHNARHVKLFVSMVDESTQPNLERTSQEHVVHFRFNNPTFGGGWTLPVAKEIIKRIKQITQFSSSATSSLTEAQNFMFKVGFSSGTKSGVGCVAGNYGFGLRCHLFEHMNIREQEDFSNQEKIVVDGNSVYSNFLNNLRQISAKNKFCDSTLSQFNSNGFVYQNGTLESGSSLSSNQRSQIENLSLCLSYLLNRFALGRTHAKYTNLVERGVTFAQASACELNSSGKTGGTDNCQCYPNGFPTQTLDISACKDIRNTYKSIESFALNIDSQRNNFDFSTSSNDSSIRALRDEFYESVTQNFVNHFFSKVCANNKELLMNVHETVGGYAPTQSLLTQEKTHTDGRPNFSPYNNSYICGGQDVATGSLLADVTNDNGGNDGSGGGGSCDPGSSDFRDCFCNENPNAPLCNPDDPY